MRSMAIKILVSVAALALLAIHHQRGDILKDDSTTLCLLFFGILPWLSDIIESAKLPGGWEFKFREVKAEQVRQATELAMLKFLVLHFVTDWEMMHLTKLAGEDLFPFSPLQSFFDELRHLRALRLIEGQHGRGIRSLMRDADDVRNHFRITALGREYIQLRREAEAKQPKPTTID